MTRILTEAQVTAFLLDSDPWLSCEDCFERVDSYVEAVAAGVDPGDRAMVVHLAACPACQDEAETLLALVTQTGRREGGRPSNVGGPG